ncbi:UvrD-helicase domain-containing protein [Halobacterium bonnevillei]|uniref:DNA 3'-5' helicase n=1 Tax=Halobacterium bonnevillei TaxID=2692200 RepID=A0A6B0SEX5_9EURY|nr:ATP-dependent DNA helicase [Halobacterium bonnevillei]MXR20304.1 UvrD-helicase domain-containing protein [Halobacterium bonnevillei]
MSSDNSLPTDATTAPAPGAWSIDHLIATYEAVMREETGNDDWSFNDGQRQVIREGDRPVHVTAGPGSGKSEVSIARVAKWLLVDGEPPRSIVLTTFTKKAAQNLEQRLVDRLSAFGVGGAIDASEVWVGTLHQLCSDIMREYRWDEYTDVELLDEDAQELFIRRESDFVDYLADGETDFFDEVIRWTYSDGGCRKVFAADAATTLFNRIGQYRVDTGALQTADHPALRRLGQARENYEESLVESARCDFTTVQERFRDFLDSTAGERFVSGSESRDLPPLKHVLVDEYQDVNPLQEAIYFDLASRMDVPSLTVVGDDDQSLYRFRGATVDALIEFPQRAERRLGVPESEIPTIQLRHNYRSRPEIVQWINRFIGYHPPMQAPGARADGKEPMRPARPSTQHPNVTCLPGDTEDSTARAFADAVERMHEEGYIEDYSQVALLTHSTRERKPWNSDPTLVGRCVRELEDRGIPFYNPRNKAFLQHDDIQVILASLIQCLDPDLQWFDENVNDSQLNPSVNDWLTTFDRRVPADSELRDRIDSIATKVRQSEPGDPMDIGLLEVFYKLRGSDPISGWTQGPDRNPTRSKRIGKLTSLLESFESIADGLTTARNLCRTSWDQYETVSTRFLGGFYWQFLEYLNSADLDDPEEVHDQIPEGHVQVMTVHQAKGLEFPVTFVGSLDQEPKSGTSHWIEDTLGPFGERRAPASADERAARDLVRQFYVAHSRAVDTLVLLGEQDDFAPGDSAIPSLGYDNDGTPLDLWWFYPDRVAREADEVTDLSTSVGDLSHGDPKRQYSVVADILAFRRCQRQYGFVREYNFEGTGAAQMFAGLVVHRTLDRAHRHFSGDIEGVDGGEVPSEDELREYFDESVEALREQRIFPVGRDIADAVFDHLREFNEEIGPSLYPKVRDTECTLRHDTEDYVLNGVVDVLVDEDTGETRVCDYKASERPDEDDDLLSDFREQLLVYATLYHQKHGEYPDTGVIYFVNEENPEDGKLTVEFDPATVDDALDRFKDTVEEIEQVRERDGWSDISESPGEQTCADCEFRYDCPAVDLD